MLSRSNTPDLILPNLLFQLTTSLDDIRDILRYKRANFESKFSYFKEQITNHEGKTLQQPNGREYEDFKEETETENESEMDEVQGELNFTKRKLLEEEEKNNELRQDVADLNALVGLYLREAQRREALEYEWQEDVTAKLKGMIRSLEDEIFRKVGEIDNLENTVEELRRALSRRDEDIFNKDQKIKSLQRKLEDCRNGIKMKKTPTSSSQLSTVKKEKICFI